MALSIGGLGSGIDTSALVQTLMQAERIPQNRVKALQDAAQKRITAWNELRTRTATVQSTAEALSTPGKALGATARSSDDTTVKVMAAEGAPPTQLSLRVLRTATAQQSKVEGLSPGMLVGAGTTVLTAGLSGTGLSAVSFSDLATDGAHTLSITSASAPARAQGSLATALTSTSLTVQSGDGVVTSLTLSSSYPDAQGRTLDQDLQAQLDAHHPGTFTATAVGGRLEVRTRAEGSGQRFTLGGPAATELGLPTTEVKGRPALVTVDGTVEEVDPPASGTLDVYLGAGITATVGTGLRTGTVSSNVVRTTAADTLSDLQAKIGVQGSPWTATTLTEGGTSTLVLTARATGTRGEVSVAAGGLPLFAGLAQVTAAADAVVELGPGLQVTRSSNRITDLVPGVTLDLLRPTTGTTTVDVQVSRDSGSTSTRAKALVDAMNALVSSVGTMTRYDATTRTGGPLTGDGTARELGRALFGQAASVGGSGVLRSLTDLGIETTREGTFAFKADVLAKALEASPEDAAQLLARLGSAVGEYAKEVGRTGGRISQSRDGAQAEVTARQRQADAMEQRLQQKEKRMRAQYAALESAMGQLKLQGSSLSAALAGLTPTR